MRPLRHEAAPVIPPLGLILHAFYDRVTLRDGDAYHVQWVAAVVVDDPPVWAAVRRHAREDCAHELEVPTREVSLLVLTPDELADCWREHTLPWFKPPEEEAGRVYAVVAYWMAPRGTSGGAVVLER